MNSVSQDGLMQRLQPYCSRKRCLKGEEVPLQDTALALYYLKEGRIEVYYTAEKTKITVALMGAGTFLVKSVFSIIFHVFETSGWLKMPKF